MISLMSVLYYLNKPVENHMSINEFITNSGFNHIMVQIMAYLDEKDIANCRLVSKTWKNYIDSKQWWITQIEYIRNTKTTFTLNEIERQNFIEEEYPEWNEVCDFFARGNGEKLKTFVGFMWQYFRNDEKHLNPLIQAASNGNVDFLEFLIDSPVDFNVKTKITGGTCVHSACVYDQHEVMEFLIKHSHVKNINVTEKNLKFGITPLHFACSDGSIEIVKFLSDYIISKDLKMFQTTNNGETLFHYAVENKQSEVPIYVFENFKDNFDNATDEDGCTALLRAISYGHEDTVNYLLDSRSKLGIDLNETTDYDENILHKACRNSRTDIWTKLIECLLEDNNGDIEHLINTRDVYGMTPFGDACESGNLEMVKMAIPILTPTLDLEDQSFVLFLIQNWSKKLLLALLHVYKRDFFYSLGIFLLELRFFGTYDPMFE